MIPPEQMKSHEELTEILAAAPHEELTVTKKGFFSRLFKRKVENRTLVTVFAIQENGMIETYIRELSKDRLCNVDNKVFELSPNTSWRYLDGHKIKTAYIIRLADNKLISNLDIDEIRNRGKPPYNPETATTEEAAWCGSDTSEDKWIISRLQKGVIGAEVVAKPSVWSKGMVMGLVSVAVILGIVVFILNAKGMI